MKNRLKNLRQTLNMSQEEFGLKIGIKSRAHISSLENGSRNITDRIVSDICSTYSVNEDWLRNGTGKMFIEPAIFSLDEYAKSHDLRESEINLIRGFMDLDRNTRNALYDMFNKAFANEMQAVLSSSPTVDAELSATIDDLEEEYKKSVLENVSKKGSIASNITKGNIRKNA